MDYGAKIPFQGDARTALGFAATVLAGIGFKIVTRDETRLEAEGPGMNNTRESPLTGASRIRLAIRSGQLELEAELGGVQKMVRFVKFFPLALGFGLSVFFVVLFGFILPNVAPNAPANPPSPWLVGGIPLMAVAPWLFIAPVMSGFITRRTIRALDTLLTNMATATGK